MSEPVECEMCGRAEGDLCDECECDAREQDARAAEFLAEEDARLYGIPVLP